MNQSTQSSEVTKSAAIAEVVLTVATQYPTLDQEARRAALALVRVDARSYLETLWARLVRLNQAGRLDELRERGSVSFVLRDRTLDAGPGKRGYSV